MMKSDYDDDDDDDLNVLVLLQQEQLFLHLILEMEVCELPENSKTSCGGQINITTETSRNLNLT